MRRTVAFLSLLVTFVLLPYAINVASGGAPEILTGHPTAALIVSILLSALIAYFEPGLREEGGPSLDSVADRLADEVKDAWLQEQRISTRGERYAMNVGWGPVAGLASSPRVEMDEIAGSRFGAFAEVRAPELTTGLAPYLLGDVPTRRLVVLGEPGSGKTMALIRLMVDVLTARSGGKWGTFPVPVMVTASSWDPKVLSFDRWLCDQLEQDYPFLKRRRRLSGGSVTLARALLGENRILPVVDGLDEISDRNIAGAMRQISDWLGGTRGIVVSCRLAEYLDVYLDSVQVPLAGAAVVGLQPLDQDALLYYLGGRGVPRQFWADLLADERGTLLAEVLTNPLMAGMARSTYSPGVAATGNGREPEHLLEIANHAELRAHLFREFVRRAYEPRGGKPFRRWTPEQAECYLTFLANLLRDGRPPALDLYWWNLADGPARRWSALVAGVAVAALSGLAAFRNPRSGVGVGIGVVLAVVIGVTLRSRLSSRLPESLSLRTPLGLGVGLLGGLGGGLAGAAVGDAKVTVGIPGGLAVGLTCGALFGPGIGSAAALLGAFVGMLFAGDCPGIPAAISSAVGAGLGVGSVVFVASPARPAARPIPSRRETVQGFLIGMVLGSAIAARAALTHGVAFTVLCWVCSTLTLGLLASLVVARLDPGAVGAMPAFKADRLNFLAFLVLGGMAGGLSLFVRLAPLNAAAGAAVGGLGLAFFHAVWARFTFARLSLAASGSLPLFTMTFLDDAHRNRGILRQVGAAYRFRHIELQLEMAKGLEPARTHGSAPG